MWSLILIIGTILGGLIGVLLHFLKDGYLDENSLWGAVIGAIISFVLCFGAKQCFDDKVFKCTDVSLPSEYVNDQKQLNEAKIEALGSKMVLEFYDKSVKCTSTFKHGEKEKTRSFVLDEVIDSYNPHIYQTNSVMMELNEIIFYVTSFTITGEKGQVLTYKRDFFNFH